MTRKNSGSNEHEQKSCLTRACHEMWDIEVKYLTCKEVLARYKLYRSTMYRWIKDGLFPAPIQLGPRCVRWKLADLEKWEIEQE